MDETRDDGQGDDGLSLRPAVERTTRFAVGAVGSLIDAAGRMVVPPPDDAGAGAGAGAGADAGADGGRASSAGDLVVGATLAAQARVLDAAEGAARAAGRLAPSGRWVAELPLVRPGVDALNRQLDELGRRGAAERAESQALVSSSIDGVVGTAVSSDLLASTVDEVVAELLPGIIESVLPDVLELLADRPELLVPVIDALLGPILDTALPEVLDKLNEEPEVVRELVLGQSVSIAGEMTNVVRARGAVADDLVERVARKLTFRRPRAELPHAPRELAAGSVRPTSAVPGEQMGRT